MSSLPIVAVVGRPNAGKSTLVNRIVGRRAAVVEEKAGVTRDRKEYQGEWAGRAFLLVDTGGWVVSPDGRLGLGIREQAEAAIRTADAVLLVVDALAGVSDDDAGVATLLRRAQVPVVLAANKVDDAAHDAAVHHLWKLGLGEPLPVSALHGRGVGELLDRLGEVLPQAEPPEELDDLPSLAIIGRPNVGKSTLLNRLLGENRILVSPAPGTTRDPIEVVVELGGERYQVVDTAGMRRASRVAEPTEYYSVVRAREVLQQADAALLVIDGTEGATHQDQRLGEEVAEHGAALVVLLNKWDLVDEEQRLATERSVGERLSFLGWAPVLRVSAKTGARLGRLPEALRLVLENRRRRVPTGRLNQLVRQWQEAHPPPPRRGRRGRILYAVQAGQEPPTVVLFSRGELGPEYLRYVENQLRQEADFTGTPIRVVTRQQARRPAHV
ncbi:MAG: ribosome biogenesis GTPase Der [Actinomycetota bacterium]|nr:ribosome biogenesis GTPase Der [Actinomycetota bacterium]